MVITCLFVPEESDEGRGFMSLSTILWCNALRLKGSTVKGRVPVSMAYMLTPLPKTHICSGYKVTLLTSYTVHRHIHTYSIQVKKICNYTDFMSINKLF